MDSIADMMKQTRDVTPVGFGAEMNSIDLAGDEIYWAPSSALLVCPLQKAARRAKLSDMRKRRATVVQQLSKASEMLRIRLVARTVAQTIRTSCKLY